jgi:hypothetical protein
MFERMNPVLTGGAKFCAVALAISVGGYLIVNAQRRANPQLSEEAPVAAGAEATPQAIDGGADGVTPASVEAATTFLMSSKSAVLEPPEPAAQTIPFFLAGSKSMVITDTSIVGADQTTADGWNLLPPPATDAPVYLPSSKSLSPGSIVYPPPAPKPGVTPARPPEHP